MHIEATVMLGFEALTPAPIVPTEVEAIELLMNAWDLAKLGTDTVLPRLIEAVLLHAGRSLAAGLEASVAA